MADAHLDLPTYAKRVAVTLGIGALVLLLIYLIWQTATVLLLVFAAILLMLFLNGVSNWLARHTPLSHRWALSLFVLVLLAAFGSIGWFVSPRLADQFGQMQEQIASAVEQIRQFLSQNEFTRPLVEDADESSSIPGGSQLVDRVTTFFSSTLGAVANFLIVIVTALYLAYDPDPYFKGILHLVPQQKRPRTREVLHAIAHALRWWLVGQLSTMAVVGVLTTIGLMIIGMPLAPMLGLIAGLLSFIPYLGPILGFVPAALVGLTQGFNTVIHVAIIFVIVQFLESNFIQPVIQKKATSLLPALLISVQVLMGVLAGFLGILLATPLTVAVVVAVQMLYVEDMLHDDEVEVLGEDRS